MALYKCCIIIIIMKGHYALRFKTHASFGAHHENLNEDRPIPLVSGNMTFMRIFAGVPGDRRQSTVG